MCPNKHPHQLQIPIALSHYDIIAIKTLIKILLFNAFNARDQLAETNYKTNSLKIALKCINLWREVK